MVRRSASGRALRRFANTLGSTRAANTKAAVISFRSFGSRPQRSARATISRNSSEPMTAPQIDRPEPAGADQGLAQDHARQAPDDHADAHLNVGEPLVLREDRARERDQGVGHHQAERDHPAHVDAQGPDHPRVVAGGPHRGPQAGPQEGPEQPGDERRPAATTAARLTASRNRTSRPSTRKLLDAARNAFGDVRRGRC